MLRTLFFIALIQFGPLRADIIDFDSLPENTVVTNQFLQAAFSSESGFQVQTLAQDLGSSLPNFICTAELSGSVSCEEDLYIDFSTPVNELSFLAVGVNDIGPVANVDVFDSTGLAGSVAIEGVDSLAFVDLGAFTSVTRIEINNVTDNVGLGYDDFSFSPVVVPETSTYLMLSLLLVALVLIRRQQLQRS